MERGMMGEKRRILDVRILVGFLWVWVRISGVSRLFAWSGTPLYKNFLKKGFPYYPSSIKYNPSLANKLLPQLKKKKNTYCKKKKNKRLKP